MTNQTPEPDRGASWGWLAPVVVTVCVALIALFAVLQITDNQAATATAQARIAHEQTAQVQAREDAKTERFQSFALALAALSNDPPFVLASVTFVAVLAAAGLVLIWRWMNGEKR